MPGSPGPSSEPDRRPWPRMSGWTEWERLAHRSARSSFSSGQECAQPTFGHSRSGESAAPCLPRKPGFATGMWRVPCARESSLFSSGRRPTGDRSVSGASGSGGRRRGRQEGVPPVRREAVTYAWKDRQLRLSTARPHTARGPSARFVHLAVYTRTQPRQPPRRISGGRGPARLTL